MPGRSSTTSCWTWRPSRDCLIFGATPCSSASSIYQACKFYELFCQAGFKGKCAIVTSYAPQAGDISKEDSGKAPPRRCASTTSTERCWLTTSTNRPTQAMTRIEEFEKQVKDKFVNQPGQMRLLIVVDKLLTGFDAPTRHLSLHRQEDAGPRPVPGDLPRQPS